jgi:hypothetical protein
LSGISQAYPEDVGVEGGSMAKELIESFEGSKGHAEVFEVISVGEGDLAVETVDYEVILNGAESHTVKTMGEAAILAAELSGDNRFQTRTR